MRFGEYLKLSRERKGMSLRDAEKVTGISNAYLNQLEKGKIKQPSPIVLHKLSQLYEVSYSEILRLVGYPVPDEAKSNHSVDRLAARLGPVTHEEEEALVEYLDFLRDRRRKGKT